MSILIPLTLVFIWLNEPMDVKIHFHSITVEPVLSGTVLSGHPLLSGQLSKSRNLCPLIIVIWTSIKRSLLLSGRGHPLLSPNELFPLSSPVLNGHFVKGNHSNMVTNSVPGN